MFSFGVMRFWTHTKLDLLHLLISIISSLRNRCISPAAADCANSISFHCNFAHCLTLFCLGMTKFPTEHFRSIVPFLALGIVGQLISFSKCLALECVLSRKHERRVKFSWQRDGSIDLATIRTQLTCMYIAYLCYIWNLCTKYMQMDGFCLPSTVGQKHNFLPATCLRMPTSMNMKFQSSSENNSMPGVSGC
jgi:hypothetical protein